MDYLGAPLAEDDRSALEAAFRLGGASSNDGGERIQRVLDRACLVGVEINPEARVKVLPGPAAPELVQHGRTGFLVDDLDAAVAAVSALPRLDRAVCRADAVERFDQHRMVDDYLELFERVVGQSRFR